MHNPKHCLRFRVTILPKSSGFSFKFLWDFKFQEDIPWEKVFCIAHYLSHQSPIYTKNSQVLGSREHNLARYLVLVRFRISEISYWVCFLVTSNTMHFGLKFPGLFSQVIIAFTLDLLRL